MSAVGIVDYGLGNLTSVAGAVARLGHEPKITGDAEALACCERLILPGVGAFGDGMDQLRRRGLVAALDRMVIGEGKPILGICLGAQLLTRESEEFGRHDGLGWIDARVVRLSPGNPALRVPHVGWNELRQRRPSVLFRDVPDRALMYFVHSYRISGANGLVTGETDHGGPVTATVEKGRVYGAQFHPEKSQHHGLTVLRNFLADG